jgi:hypothetical protein
VPDNPYTTHLENSGGDAFDIGWAVDSLGQYVDLDRVHFFRVQAALLHEGSYLGEVSTEICGAVDVPPAPGTEGIREMLVMADLPPEIPVGSHQLETFFFRDGRLQDLPPLRYETSAPWATVNENHVLELSGEGPLSIRVELVDSPSVHALLETRVRGGQLLGGSDRPLLAPHVYPNPAGTEIRLSWGVAGPLQLFTGQGILIQTLPSAATGEGISLEGLSPGMYVLRAGRDAGYWTAKFIKQ